MKDQKLSAVLEMTCEDVQSAVLEWVAARTTAKVVKCDIFSDDKGIRGNVEFELSKR
jgi:hypothetical protein